MPDLHFSSLPDNDLKFDAESSYCYVTTTYREEAKAFKLYVYNKYIKEYISGWLEGWDDFVKEWKAAPDDEKFNLTVLQ